MTRDALLQLPKVELHCHLDGSLSRSFIEARLGRAVQESELSVTDDCKSLVEYLEKFALPLQCLQDPDGLAAAGYDLLQTMHSENVIYAEIRFAPLLSVSEHMDVRLVIESLLRGLETGREAFGVEYNVISCAMRHQPVADNLEMFRVAREFLGYGVCAADLAGSEADYPMCEFMDLFREVRHMDFPFTLHAGECGNARNIAEAVKVGAKRIGHGIAMRGNAELESLLVKQGIGIELCPISNLQTKAVPDVSVYPLREFLDAGLAVSINTDNRTVSHTSLTRELEFVQTNCGISDAELLQMQRNAIGTAFLDDTGKASLWKKLEQR